MRGRHSHEQDQETPSRRSAAEGEWEVNTTDEIMNDLPDGCGSRHVRAAIAALVKERDDYHKKACEIADQRDEALARAEKAEELLKEADSVLSLCDQRRSGRVHDHMDMQAAAHGERDGYGAWMDAIQRMWEARDPAGCFTVGPCLGTVRHMREKIAKHDER